MAAHAHPELAQSKPARVARDNSLDIAKGFGILLVVLGHCFDGLIASKFFPETLLWPTLVVYAIYLFHMPLFFVISGHLASGKHRPAGTTVARLLPSIVYPYFLWSIVEGLVLVYLSKYTTSKVQIASLFHILWIPIIPYWFLYALFFCHLGYLAVRKLSYPWQMAIAAAAFLSPLLFLFPLSHWGLTIVPETVRGFLYFILGVVSVTQVKRLGRWSAIVATVLYVAFAAAFWIARPSLEVGSIVVLPAAIAGIAATLAWSRLLAERGGWLANTLALWGRYSMSIYVLHIFFTAGVRIALKRLAPASGSLPTITATMIEIVAATVLGVLLPLAINWTVSRANLDKWFGLQHMEPRAS
jgi:fucose 4-O-acetylase-like acetyltransferase